MVDTPPDPPPPSPPSPPPAPPRGSSHRTPTKRDEEEGRHEGGEGGFTEELKDTLTHGMVSR